jgi:hypothetical protein
VGREWQLALAAGRSDVECGEGAAIGLAAVATAGRWAGFAQRRLEKKQGVALLSYHTIGWSISDPTDKNRYYIYLNQKKGMSCKEQTRVFLYTAPRLAQLRLAMWC